MSRPNSQEQRLTITAGANTDGSGQVVPILDMNNAVLLKDGTGIGNRDGLEIRKHYNVFGVPAGQKVPLKESAPPDVDLGNMFLMINPAQGLSTVEWIEFMRDRTQLQGESYGTELQLVTNDTYFTITFAGESTMPASTVFATLGGAYRTGDLSVPASASLQIVASNFPNATIEQMGAWLAAHPLVWDAGQASPNSPWDAEVDAELDFPTDALPNGPLGPYNVQVQLIPTSDSTTVNPTNSILTIAITITEI